MTVDLASIHVGRVEIDHNGEVKVEIHGDADASAIAVSLFRCTNPGLDRAVDALNETLKAAVVERLMGVIGYVPEVPDVPPAPTVHVFCRICGLHVKIPAGSVPPEGWFVDWDTPNRAYCPEHADVGRHPATRHA